MIVDILHHLRILQQLLPFALASAVAMGAIASGRISWLRFRTAPLREVPLWSGLDVLLCFVVYILSQIIAEVLGIWLETNLGWPEASFLWVRQLSWATIFLAFAALVVWKVHGPRLTPLRFQASSPRNLPGVLLLCGLCFLPLSWIHALSLLLLRLAGFYPEPQAPVEAFRSALSEGDAVRIAMLVVAAVLVAPLCEEILFRGFLHGFLRLRWGVVAGGIVSSVVFALFHFSPGAFLPLLLVGILLVYVLERTGSMLYAMLFHAAFNAIQLLAMLSVGG